MIIVFASLTLLMLFYSFIHTKYIASPVVISGIIWFSLYLLLFLVVDPKRTNDIYYGCFCLAYFMFISGYRICEIFTSKKEQVIKWKYKIKYNLECQRIILILEYVFSLYLVLKISQTSVIATSIWTRVRRTENLKYLNEGVYAVVIHIAIPVIFFIFWAIYLLDDRKENKKCFVKSIIPLLLSLLFLSRVSWFFVIITVVFTYIYMKRIDNKKLFKIGIVFVILFLIIFIVSTLDKYSNTWVWMSPTEKVKTMFKSYFVNPAIAYVDWLHSEKELLYGKNTFRFIFAVLSKFNKNIEVLPVVQEFVETDGIAGNVYTVLHKYSEDYGIGWALFIQFLFGILYSFLYSKIFKESGMNKVYYVIALSMLLYPLIAQFFDDKYFPTLSLWIKQFILLFLLTRKRLFVIQKIKGIEV